MLPANFKNGISHCTGSQLQNILSVLTIVREKYGEKLDLEVLKLICGAEKQVSEVMSIIKGFEDHYTNLLDLKNECDLNSFENQSNES